MERLMAQPTDLPGGTALLPTLLALQQRLDSGETTAVELTEAALARIDDPAGEGRRTFIKTWHERARAAARASDLLRAAGIRRSPIEGLPISVKDLFDVAGEVTLAGSVVLDDAPPAARDAAVVQRLQQAGAVLVGRTNMTEFAYSGLGLNPHHGTPRNPWDRATGRIPGGSSSGAAVSVTDGMAVTAIGTDTGGSVRIPSALCGLTGFKPTAARIPATGALPLSTSLDSIGPLAASVACCATLDAIMAGERYVAPGAPVLRQLRFAVPDRVVLDGADAQVHAMFERTLAAIRAGGAQIDVIALPEFEELAQINRSGGFSGAEAWTWHRSLLTRGAARYDPRVASRILRGRDMTAADYIELRQARAGWIARVEARLAHYDALLMPTVPIVAPAIEPLVASDEAYFAANALILRNPTLINFLDGCALSLPCHAAGSAPVGLTVAAPGGRDRAILEIGVALEAVLAAA
jgi:aspartyl-tRNA(Asn)/glutamyl-tRNA(Gln) amidotransferase subunit A